MADKNHLFDLIPPHAVNGAPQKPEREKIDPARLPERKKPKRPWHLKYKSSLKIRQERESRDWISGVLAALLVGIGVSLGIWWGLWHVPVLAPWSFLIKDPRTPWTLATNISLLWLGHIIFPAVRLHGYTWAVVFAWLKTQSFLESVNRIMELSLGGGAVAGGIAFHFFSKGRLKETHTRGKQLFERPIDAVRELNQEIKKSGKGILVHPDVPVSRDRETRHFLIMGAIGSGKTQILRNILHSIFERMTTSPEDRVILYDNKSDMTAGIPVHDDQIILLAPWDSRTWAWDVGRDIINASDAATFAERLIPDSKDKFWSEAPRQIVKACIQHLQTTRGTDWAWKDLAKALNSQDTILGSVMLYAPTLAPVFVGTGGGPTSTGASLLSSMNAFTGSIDELCRAWDNTNPRTGEEIESGRVIPRFSLREWALTPVVQRRVIILQGNKRYLTLERAYIQSIISAFGAIMNSPEMPDSKTRRVWLIIDEFPQLGKVEHFAQYLEVGRSKGLCVILGLQDLAQLREIYGRDTADVWASICGTYIICRSQGVETVTWLSRFFGERTIRTVRKSISENAHGKTTTTIEESSIEPVVTSDVLHGLGDNKGRSPGILALLGLNTEKGVYRLIWPYITFPDRRPNQRSAFWTTRSSGSGQLPPIIPDQEFQFSSEERSRRHKKRGRRSVQQVIDNPEKS